MHTTLNPKGPGAVRIHLIPPKWRPFSDAPYVMILNGYYILLLGYSWAILLRNFIREVNVYDGRPINEAQMKQVMDKAVSRTKRVYYVKTQELQEDLQEMLDLLYGVARGGEPSGNIGPLSLREYAANMTGAASDGSYGKLHARQGRKMELQPEMPALLCGGTASGRHRGAVRPGMV